MPDSKDKDLGSKGDSFFDVISNINIGSALRDISNAVSGAVSTIAELAKSASDLLFPPENTSTPKQQPPIVKEPETSSNIREVIQAHIVAANVLGADVTRKESSEPERLSIPDGKKGAEHTTPPPSPASSTSSSSTNRSPSHSSTSSNRSKNSSPGGTGWFALLSSQNNDDDRSVKSYTSSVGSSNSTLSTRSAQREQTKQESPKFTSALAALAATAAERRENIQEEMRKEEEEEALQYQEEERLAAAIRENMFCNTYKGNTYNDYLFTLEAKRACEQVAKERGNPSLFSPFNPTGNRGR